MKKLFLFVGPAKTLTSVLEKSADKYSELILPKMKETHFLSQDFLVKSYYKDIIPSYKKRLGIGEKFYDHFEKEFEKKNFAEFCPSYILSKQAMKYCKSKKNIYPIITYRDPKKRCISHFLMDKRLGLNKNSSIEKSINSSADFYQQYFCLSDYDFLIKKWLKFSDNLLILDPIKKKIYGLDNGLNHEKKIVAEIIISLCNNLEKLEINKGFNINNNFLKKIYKLYIKSELKINHNLANFIKNFLNRNPKYDELIINNWFNKNFESIILENNFKEIGNE